MVDAVQIAGAIVIVTAFTLAQLGRLDQRSVVYLVLNLVGSVALAVVALVDGDAGFVLLETVWAIVSAAGLVRLASDRRVGSAVRLPGAGRGPSGSP